MELKMNQGYYKGVIRRCHQNIESTKRSNFTPLEKEKMIESYNHQIKLAERKLLSFLNNRNK